MNQALDRDALYYPYIHIRDVNWLKATLLAFPQVRRMVPHDFFMNDSLEVQKFRQLMGPRGPLLMEQELMVNAVISAQMRLKMRLEELDNFSLEKFSQRATANAYGGNTNIFRIHRHKFMEDLFSFLEIKNLIWPSQLLSQGQHIWYGLHPELGEAIMSIIAIALAQEQGLDIVTDSGDVHYALATQNEEAVFQTLIKGGVAPAVNFERRIPGMVDELLQLVMTTRFDVSRLTPEQIAELIQEGKSLYTFKQHLVPMVSGIPNIIDPKERRKRLKTAAQGVMAEWEEYRRTLPRFAKEALRDGITQTLPSFVKNISVAAIVAGTVTTTLLGALPGLALGLVVFGGLELYKNYQEHAANPYRYLSKIHRAGATVMMTVPTGLG